MLVQAKMLSNNEESSELRVLCVCVCVRDFPRNRARNICFHSKFRGTVNSVVYPLMNDHCNRVYFNFIIIYIYIYIIIELSFFE